MADKKIRGLKSEIKVDTKDFDRAQKRSSKFVKEQDKDSKEVSKSWSNFGKVFAGLGIVVGIKSIVSSIQSLVRETIKFEAEAKRASTVFGDSMTEIRKAGLKMSEGLGVSLKQFSAMSAGIGDLLIPIGFMRSEAAKMSTETLELAGSLKQFTGDSRSLAEISEVVAKSFLGEREGLVSLGVKISEADVQQRLFEKGQKKLTGTMLAQAKATATMELLTEKSTDALTAYRSGQNELQKETNKLTKAFQRFKERGLEKSGSALVFIIKQTGLVIGIFNNIIDALDQVTTSYDDATEATNKFIDAQKKQVEQGQITSQQQLDNIRNRKLALQIEKQSLERERQAGFGTPGSPFIGPGFETGTPHERALFKLNKQIKEYNNNIKNLSDRERIIAKQIQNTSKALDKSKKGFEGSGKGAKKASFDYKALSDSIEESLLVGLPKTLKRIDNAAKVQLEKIKELQKRNKKGLEEEIRLVNLKQEIEAKAGIDKINAMGQAGLIAVEKIAGIYDDISKDTGKKIGSITQKIGSIATLAGAKWGALVTTIGIGIDLLRGLFSTQESIHELSEAEKQIQEEIAQIEQDRLDIAEREEALRKSKIDLLNKELEIENRITKAKNLSLEAEKIELIENAKRAIAKGIEKGGFDENLTELQSAELVKKNIGILEQKKQNLIDAEKLEAIITERELDRRQRAEQFSRTYNIPVEDLLAGRGGLGVFGPSIVKSKEEIQLEKLGTSKSIQAEIDTLTDQNKILKDTILPAFETRENLIRELSEMEQASSNLPEPIEIPSGRGRLSEDDKRAVPPKVSLKPKTFSEKIRNLLKTASLGISQAELEGLEGLAPEQVVSQKLGIFQTLKDKLFELAVPSGITEGEQIEANQARIFALENIARILEEGNEVKIENVINNTNYTYHDEGTYLDRRQFIENEIAPKLREFAQSIGGGTRFWGE
jgi:hypothetical protein